MDEKEASCMTDNKKTLPEKHVIAYPEKYAPDLHKDGASSFGGITDHANSRYYVFNDYYNMVSDETLHILTHFETYQQTTEYTCGAACALMVLNWFGQKRYHERLVGQLIESREGSGSTVENIADLFDLIGWNVEYHAGTDLKFDTIEGFEQSVIDFIDRGIPILVDWVDWAGHWQVIIGYDDMGTADTQDDVLIVADPYDTTDHNQDGYGIYPAARFFSTFDMYGQFPEKEGGNHNLFLIASPAKVKM